MTSIINTAKVPIALKSQNRWVALKYETKDGRATKIPYSAANGGSLRRASTIDPKTWCGFFQAKRFSEEHSMAGIGFCFEGSGIAGVDFDGCRDPKSGVIDEWALNEIRKLDSYSEISPSNSGVKVFVRGQLPGPGAKAISQNGGHGGKMRAIELYDSGRYFAVTGNALPELPAAVEARDLTNLYHRVKKALSPSPAATISSIAKIPSGQSHGFLLTHAGKLLQRGIGQEALEVELLRLNREMFQEPKDEATIRKQAQDFLRRWQVSPALVLTGTRQQPITAEQEFSVSIKMLSEVEARPVRWFWEPFIPLGMLSMLSGDPGAGKSFIALDRAADVTRQGETVVYLTIENPAAEILRPRFDALDGDPTKLVLVEGVNIGGPADGVKRAITLQDVPAIESVIREKKPKVLIIDPLQSFLGAGVDAYRSNETRPVLNGLAKLAEQYRIAVLILRHLSKAGAGRAIYMGLGSIDFTGAVRSELLAGQSTDGQRAVVHIKSNIGPLGPAQGYEITETDKAGHLWLAGYFQWTGESELTVTELTRPEQSTEEKSAVKEAEEFLREALRAGPMLGAEVIREAHGTGICQRTLERGKQKLGITVRKQTGDGRWEWLLPDEKSNKDAKTANNAISTDVGGLVGVNHPAKDTPAKPYKPGLSPWTGRPYPPAYVPYKPGGGE